jgi:hypothetical protein
VARAAGLVTVAGLPLAAGLTGPAYRDTAAMSAGFRTAMLICAALLAAAALLSAGTISNNVLRAGQAHPAQGMAARGPDRSVAREKEAAVFVSSRTLATRGERRLDGRHHRAR